MIQASICIDRRFCRWSACGRIVLAAALLAIAPMGVARGDTSEQPSDEHDRAAEMVEQVVAGNIFSAERGRREPEPEPARTADPEPREEPASPSNPDASLVLVGVVVHADVGYAFIEDLRDGGVRRVTAPGGFGRGEITAIDIDGVVYEVDGSSKQIGLRQNFAGDESDAFAEAGDRERRRGDPRDQVERAPTPEAASDRQAILERMRQRRERETSSNSPTP